MGGAAHGKTSLTRPLVLVDTGVWLDYLTDRKGTAHDIALVFEEVERRGGALLTALTSLQDIFRLTVSHVRSALEEAHDQTSEASQRAMAWGCVKMIRERSALVEMGMADIIRAEQVLSPRGDLSDALVLVAAQRSRADILLTENEQLKAAAPTLAAGVVELSGRLGIEGGRQMTEVCP